MKPDTISLRRRHLMIAGLAGVGAPLAIFADHWSAKLRDGTGPLDEAIGGGGTQKLVVSGRILAPDTKPLADAIVEAWHANANGDRASVTTDADGRFMFTTIAPAEYPGRPRHLHYRVSHKGRATPVTQLHFAREPGVPDEVVAHLQCDDAGVWRATFGRTLA